MADSVQLRDVRGSDLPIFFEQQLEPVANRMAAFPARDTVAFLMHWKTTVLPDETSIKKTIVVGETVVGYVVSWQQSGRRLVGYWIGKDHWGKGIATQALTRFLDALTTRPLYAYVAKHNVASLRVLEKCGFTPVEQGRVFSEVHGQEVDDVLLALR
jgi:RimJ/RimL family protein N-acetyltransferase